jgi:hypothetical protein
MTPEHDSTVTVTPNHIAVVAQAASNPTLASRPLQDALRAAIASRRGYGK